MIDLILVGIIGVVTWCVAAEGAWGAILVLFSVILGGLFATNFFETVAALIEGSFPSWANQADVIAFLLLFGVSVFVLRLMFDNIAKLEVPLNPTAYKLVCWGAGLISGYVTMAIMLTALHTAPFPREFMGFKPERRNFMEVAAPDRQWLGFVQHTTEKLFPVHMRIQDPKRELKGHRVFDGELRALKGYENGTYLATFILRYATRREMNESKPVQGAGGGLLVPSATDQTAPPPASPPTGSF